MPHSRKPAYSGGVTVPRANHWTLLRRYPHFCAAAITQAAQRRLITPSLSDYKQVRLLSKTLVEAVTGGLSEKG